MEKHRPAKPGAAADVKRQATDTDDKPAMDEASFQELLSAAYVLQQHNERSQSGAGADSGYSKTLAQILETQEQVRSRRLDLQPAAALIALRLRDITNASGTAVGVVDGNQLEYRAGAGTASAEVGTRVPLDSCLAAKCFATGTVMQCPEAENDARLRTDLCRQLGVKALIAAPVLHEGTVAGVVELRFSQSNCFQEHDVRSCQLMAVLVAEVMAHHPALDQETPGVPAPEHESEQERLTANKRASMLAALEKIKPQLERLAGVSPVVPPPPPAVPSASGPEPALAPDAAYCSCGHQFGKEELFCGTCGSSRPAKDLTGQSQSVWSSLWDLQRAAEKSGTANQQKSASAEDTHADATEVLPSELEDIVAKFSAEPATAKPAEPREGQPLSLASQPALKKISAVDVGKKPPGSVLKRASPGVVKPAAKTHPSPTASVVPKPADRSFGQEDRLPSFAAGATLPSFAVSSSGTSRRAAEQDSRTSADQTALSLSTSALPVSATTGKWPEAQQANGGWSVNQWLVKQWHTRRANIYLGAAGLLLLAVLFGWGGPDVPPTNAGTAASAVGTRRRKTPPKPQLSFGDQLLVDLGLAEAPAPPADLGNPSTKVWVDVHTALYYCPGSELYGKTPGGKYTSQQEAQEDEFQPAARKACE